MRRLLLLVNGLVLVLALAASAGAEPRNSVSSLFPLYDNGPYADLTVDPQRFTSQMEIVDRYFDETSCELVEGSINAPGYRRILRFDTVLINAGATLVTGSPTDPQNPYYSVFEFSPCHDHYHIRDFADYRLLNMDRTLAAAGHKQAFCFISSLKYSNDLNGQDKPSFSCSDQGIARGYGDWYYKQLSGQWIDITGVPRGDYIVQVRINAAGTFPEGENRYPNVIETVVRVPDPRNKVAVDTSSVSYDG
jgi:hypothetical protein